MFRSALRAASRRQAFSRLQIKNSAARRFLSTAPPAQKSRSWKSAAARWGLAGAGIYYYNTSNVFAEEPEAAIQTLDESLHNVQESNLSTIDAIMEEKRLRQAQAIAEQERKEHEQAAKTVAAEGTSEEGEEGMEGLQGEADQQGAFNPETGEINWDCPCLGGMATGPCGEEFKAAFSCFVYSKEEPKGVDCIEKFNALPETATDSSSRGMQDCFRQHPETYASELEDDEDEVEQELRAREMAKEGEELSVEPQTPSTSKAIESSPKPVEPVSEPAVKKSRDNTGEAPKEQEHFRDSRNAKSETVEHVGDEGGELVPKAAFDAKTK
ncbi:CHCH domain-containing protein [Rutstroemia sp. NJR-2017a BBW]|nr:CHCH domain-containing protein [Rutstroemia sp. NJR-2017a BBW]